MAESTSRIKEVAQNAFNSAFIEFDVNRVVVRRSRWRRRISWVPFPWSVFFGQRDFDAMDLEQQKYARLVAHEFFHAYQIVRDGLGEKSWWSWWTWYLPRRVRLEWEANSFSAQHARRLVP